jgi:hypothetical protein
MPFDPADFNSLAAVLVGSRTGEAEIRTAIGRFYYAAHLTARERLSKRGWSPTGRGRDHALVISELSSRRFKKESDQLAYLKELRACRLSFGGHREFAQQSEWSLQIHEKERPRFQWCNALALARSPRHKQSAVP